MPEFPDDQGFIVCESDFVFTKEEADRMKGAATNENCAQESLAEHLRDMMIGVPDSPAGAAFKKKESKSGSKHVRAEREVSLGEALHRRNEIMVTQARDWWIKFVV